MERMWPRSRIHSSSGETSESCSNWARLRFLFLSGTRSILHPYLNMRMYFIVLRKGIFLGCAHETENKARLAFAEDIRLKKTLQNSITARFTGDWYWKTDCFVAQNLALLLTKIRSLV